MGINWAVGVLRWQPHVDRDKRAYPLNHLHPFRYACTLEATEKLPERTLMLHFGFSMHCFTHKIMAYDDPGDDYSDNRETRAFDYERYQLSFRLPQIAKELTDRPCYFARATSGLLNYVTVELDGAAQYAAFFDLKRWPEQGKDAILIVFESAYTLEPKKGNPGKGRIAFKALLGHTIRGTRPKPPP
jgi:hypothetical protein